MNAFDWIYNKIVYREYQKISKSLLEFDESNFDNAILKQILKITKNSYDNIEAYKAIADLNKSDLSNLLNIESFKNNVPIIDKQSFFETYDLEKICKNRDFSKVKLFYSSSGSSQVFSYGMETWENAKNDALQLEFLAEDYFGALNKKTLVINCLPMGVKINTRTLPLIESGQRVDVICALIKKLKSKFEQFIFIGEHLLIKKLIEFGIKENINWKDINVHIITGAEYIPENFRSYIGHHIGMDFNNYSEKSLIISLGLSEISNSLARESFESQRLRRLAHLNPEHRETIYGHSADFCAPIMQYHPLQYYMELINTENKVGELVITTLDKSRQIPLIRYNTKDYAQLVKYNDFLNQVQVLKKENFQGKYKLPFILVWGKLKYLEIEGKSIYPECIKEAIYENFDIAQKLSGHFSMKEQNQNLLLEFQCSIGSSISEPEKNEFAEILRKWIKVPFEIKIYQFAQYPRLNEQTVEKKANYFY